MTSHISSLLFLLLRQNESVHGQLKASVLLGCRHKQKAFKIHYIYCLCFFNCLNICSPISSKPIPLRLKITQNLIFNPLRMTNEETLREETGSGEWGGGQLEALLLFLVLRAGGTANYSALKVPRQCPSSFRGK